MFVLGMTFLVYAARMWARLAITKNAGVDDLLMSIAMLPLFGLKTSVVLGKLTIYVVELLLNVQSDQGVRVPMARRGQTDATHITTREVGPPSKDPDGTRLTSTDDNVDRA